VRFKKVFLPKIALETNPEIGGKGKRRAVSQIRMD